MVAVDIIARYESLHRQLAEIEKRLGIEGALADEEANRIDAELVELEKRLRDGHERRDA
jgi:ABC-type phosphate transport system auxiliary subunit